MDFISRILPHGAVTTGLVTLSFAVVLGLILGAIRVRGISLGLAAVLFAGLAMGAAGFDVNDEALVFVRSFSLIIFVYAVGLQVGPGFLAAFKSEGLKMNALSAAVVILGAVLTLAIVMTGRLPRTSASGLYTGAFSSTPAFAAGQEALLDRLYKHSHERSAGDTVNAVRESGVIFAVTYPIGVLAPILLIILMRWVFRVNVVAERAALENARPGARGALQSAHHQHHGDVARARILATRTAELGKTLANLDLANRFHVTVTHVHRAGVEIPARPGLKLQFADHLHVIGPHEGIDSAAKLLGNSTAALKRPQLLPIFVGIVLGVLAGSVPIELPGLHSGIKLGLAGGPLLVAILLSRLGHIGSVVWYMPAAASNLLRDFGMALFLACTGLGSGGQVATILRGDGLIYVGWGALISILPVFLVAMFARIVMKMNFVKLAGLISGSMTSTPTMLFAIDFTKSEQPAEIFAAVYPLGMLIPVFASQWLVAALV